MKSLWYLPDLKRQKKSIKPKNPIKMIGFLVVVPPGIEPGTQGFSVLAKENL